MLMLCAPTTPMQGSFVRSVPARLSTSLFTSVSRRVSWTEIARCSGGSNSSQSINPNSTPPPPSKQADIAPLPDSALPSLAPLPSTSRNGTFRLEGGDGLSSLNARFRSVGSRSEPSLPSIPGKFSKYSKPISKLHTANVQKRAERRDKKAFRKPMGDIALEPDWNVISRDENSAAASSAAVAGTRNSVSPPPVDKIPDWMKQYQFSYSEVPSAPIIGFRETPWSPFGPSEMVERPWTGRAPLTKSKKKLPQFDSFKPPPPGKKGVKYVQRPGPFPPGEGPKPGRTREEILGAPLTPLEIQELVNTVNKGSKQLNLGRDGLTHNMLDVIHNHWKRSVCCKIKCKGVPTIDMDNVARAIEDKTGGVIIHRAGGVMYVFRGRNYNFKDRPVIPIMLWKPPDPIYPRLIQAIPEGLTEIEAKELRAKGRKVASLCKLSKNGVYLTLVQEVRAQFEIDEVVRVDCQGMHTTDYKKIGAKLRDLVPCTLLSFEKEQIIMCRKKPIQIENVQPIPEEGTTALDVSVDNGTSMGSTGLHVTEQHVSTVDEQEQKLVLAEGAESVMDQRAKIATLVEDGNPEESTSEDQEDPSCVVGGHPRVAASVTDGNFIDISSAGDGHPKGTTSGIGENLKDESVVMEGNPEHAVATMHSNTEDVKSVIDGYPEDASSIIDENINPATSGTNGNTEGAISVTDSTTEGSILAGMDSVDLLWQKAIAEGKALQLDNQIADPDLILEKAAELSDVLEATDSEEWAAKERLLKETAEQNKIRAQAPPTSPFDELPMGHLGVDELAKLLAP